MVKGTTKSGIAFEVDETALDDMELIDALAELESGNALAVSTATMLLFGKDGRKKIYDQVKERNGGRVPAEAFIALLPEIFEAIGADGKK